MRHAAIDVTVLRKALSAMCQRLGETACMDSRVMSRRDIFWNTTVGFRLERRRALWRVMLEYTEPRRGEAPADRTLPEGMLSLLERVLRAAPSGEYRECQVKEVSKRGPAASRWH